MHSDKKYKKESQYMNKTIITIIISFINNSSNLYSMHTEKANPTIETSSPINKKNTNQLNQIYRKVEIGSILKKIAKKTFLAAEIYGISMIDNNQFAWKNPL